MSTTSVPELYGSLVFNDKVMRERLPKDIYKAVHKTIQNGSIWSWTWRIPSQRR